MSFLSKNACVRNQTSVAGKRESRVVGMLVTGLLCKIYKHGI